MTEDDFTRICLCFPGTEKVIQWEGARVFKVGGKVFAILVDARGTGPLRATMKCADTETADFLIEIGVAVRAPHLPRGGWVQIPLAGLDDDDLAARLATSYDTVRAGLPAAARAALG